MSKADGSIIIDTQINTDGFSKGASDLKSQFGGLGSSLKKLAGLVATAFSVQAISNFAKEAIELGSDLQEVQNVVDVTFTTMNEQVNNFAQTAAKTAGLSETMAKKYMGTFGAMSKSFNFTEEQAYAMSASLTQLTGDVASFYNLSQDGAYTKLKSVFTGETESLKDLGVVMTQTALDDFAMRQGIGKTTAQMSEQEKVALRYKFVLEQLQGASGDFVRTADGWANQTRVLSLQFEQLKATMGQGFINVLTPVIQMINILIEKLQTFAVMFKKITEALFGNASDDSGGVAGSFDAAADSAEDLGDAVTAAGKAAKKSLAGFDELTLLADQSSGSGGGGSSGSTSMGDFNLDFSTDNLTGATDSIIGSVQPIVDKIKELFAPLKEIDYTNLKNAFGKLGDSLSNLGSVIGSGLEWAWFNVLVPLGEWVIEEAAPVLVEALASAFDFVSVVLQVVAPLFETLWSIIQPVIGFIGDVALWAVEGLGNQFKYLAEWLVYSADEAYVFSEAEQEIIDKAKQATESFKTQVDAYQNRAGDIDAEIDRIDRLARELDGLVDANGRVKDSDKARVDFILQELNGALDTEYKRIGDIVGGYQNLQTEITNTLAAKKASLLLDELNGVYLEAIKAKEDTYEAMKIAEKAYLKQKEQFNKKVKEMEGSYNSDAQEILNQEMIRLNEKYIEYAKWEEEYKATLSRINQYEESSYELSAGNYQQAADLILAYEDIYEGTQNRVMDLNNALTENSKGNIAEVEEILKKGTGAYIGYADSVEDETGRAKAALEQQVKDAELEVESLSDALESGVAGVSQAMLDEAKATHAGLLNEYNSIGEEGKKIGSDFVGGFSKGAKGLGDIIADLVGKGIKAISDGLKSGAASVGTIIGSMASTRSITTGATTNLPYLAKGAVIPPNAPFMAVLGDQRRGTNIEAPLSTIQEAVANVTAGQTSALLAGFEALLEENRQLRAVVEGIEVGDTVIGEAAGRYNHKMAILNGG